MEKQPLNSCQTSVRENFPPQSAVRLLEPIPVNTSHEADSDSDISVMLKPHIRKKRSRSFEEKFFILTSDEAYAAKVK